MSHLNPQRLLTTASESLTWKQALAQVIRDPQALCDALELSQQNQTQLLKACDNFPLRVPLPYLQRIKKNDLSDPLLLQILPQAQELIETVNYTSDPLEEKQCSPLDGLLHKYHGRVLLILNSSCAVHCRYCFRRHFPYKEHQLSHEKWQAILNYITHDSSIEEVIFSGGDPLSSTDERLSKYIHDIEKIKHITRLRMHTRLPVVIPQRITNAFIQLVSSTRLQTTIVIHSNHAQELDDFVQERLLLLSSSGISLLNQSVLLKNINDNTEALAHLSKRLFECKVLPYYVHMLDFVQGAAHFEVNKQQAHIIFKQLQEVLPGYLVPKFVIELPKEKHKTLI